MGDVAAEAVQVLGRQVPVALRWKATSALPVWAACVAPACP